jgi:hypothetical protein
MDTYVATADDITIERLTDEPGRVVIKNVPNHEFRALNGDIVLKNWTSDNQETIEFLFTKLETGTFTKVATAPDLDINALIQPDSPAGQIILTNNLDYEFRLINGETELIEWKNYTTDTITFEFNAELTPTIEARGVDATIIFDAIQGLTYDVTLAGVPVLSDIVDNGSLDEDATAAKITISGLTEGITYDIAFKGQLPDAALTDITIESRSTDASISFTAFEGFTYEVKSGETMIKANLKDNQEGDLNEKEGVITIKGLIQGLPYDVHYEGNVVLETITQDEVDGQVDKLFVLYQYTFVSFVPINLNERPKQDDLDLEYDGVSTYDKTNFQSNSTRQSFVIDNESGLIYKIENIVISNLSGGCVSIQNNPYPFDMRITESKNLQFYSLFENPSITMNSCIKDKSGQKVILNNTINTYDEINKTLYYTKQNNWTRSGYWLTSKGEILKIHHYTSLGQGNIEKFSILTDLSKNLEEKITSKDNFEVYITNSTSYPADLSITLALPGKDLSLRTKFIVNQGRIFTSRFIHNVANIHQQKFTQVFYRFENISFTEDTTNILSLNLPNSVLLRDAFGFQNATQPGGIIPPTSINQMYFDQDIVLMQAGDKIYEIKDLRNQISTIFNGLQKAIYSFDNFNFTYSENPDYKKLQVREILSNVVLINGSVTKVGLTGNSTYEFYIETIDGEKVVKPFVTGNYVAPPPATITFQPINN